MSFFSLRSCKQKQQKEINALIIIIIHRHLYSPPVEPSVDQICCFKKKKKVNSFSGICSPNVAEYFHLLRRQVVGPRPLSGPIRLKVFATHARWVVCSVRLFNLLESTPPSPSAAMDVFFIFFFFFCLDANYFPIHGMNSSDSRHLHDIAILSGEFISTLTFSSGFFFFACIEMMLLLALAF